MARRRAKPKDPSPIAPAGFLPRVIGMVVPLSFHRRRITQAAEVILSNVDLYASVTTRVVGTRLLMELRSPIVVPPQVLEGLRLYLARKLQAVLGLKLAPAQIYLVSLPPADDPDRLAPTTRALKRMVQFLPQWSSSEMRRGAVSEPSQPSTFADLRNSVPPPNDLSFVSTQATLRTQEGQTA